MRKRNRMRSAATAVTTVAVCTLGLAACSAGAWADTDPARTGSTEPVAAPQDGAGQGAPQDPATSGTSAAPDTGAAPGTVPESFAKTSEGGPHTVDITIDDGPSPAWTPKVLAVLAQNHVHATFCMIGKNAAKYPALVKQVAAAGNRLCDHSVDHDMTMDKKPADYQKWEILKGQNMIDRAAGGPAAMYYRAPGGAFTPTSRGIAARHGLRPLGWDVDPRDWSRPGTANIITTVKEELKDGPIILFHDGGGNRSQTVAALRYLLPWFKQQGYGFSFPAQST
ncbi:polysaccharide deacetylase family protein [Streptomyces sp. NPDC006487]|uniref:polysaccharide deacetylase family protein n=1 Tax=Streptomyces sp. NPDC006487 TaxID=3364748 RepID=UPI0036ACBE8C